MRIGYLPGVFDLFHVGHKNIIDRALQQCDSLVIGIHTDQFVTEYKRCPVQNQNERLDILRSVYGFVYYEIVGNSHTEIINKYGITHVFHGSDWELESYKRQIRYYEDKLTVEIVILPYTDSISTTQILKYASMYRDITTIFFDLDKTLLLNGEATNGAVECIRYIQTKSHLNINVITNNNKYTPDQISESLKNANIQISPDQIRSPLIQIRDYLTEINIKKAFVWGTDNAKQYLHNYCSVLNDAEMIVVLYNDKFTYAELCEMLTHIRTKPYIVSNIDMTYPDKHVVLPDTGITQYIIEKTTGKLPERIFGKPYNNICSIKDSCLMVGDSLITDGKLAENLGIPFFHVSGVQDLQMLYIILQSIHK
jgi:cytidyltransferase-like protein